MYLSNDVNQEILKFCNNTGSQNVYKICKIRQYNNTDFILQFSTQNLKIYKNLTDEIKQNYQIFLNNTAINNPNINFTVQNEDSYTTKLIDSFTKVDFNLLSLITQITLLVFYFMFYNSVTNQMLEVDIMNLSPADYTLMLSEFKLPEDVGNFTELKTYLETQVIRSFLYIFFSIILSLKFP